ncbi:hypothetical protein N7495_007738 [Penicillium taxi]|uniref:uncharacterized protein n=1 Tax=Penicillium taxi TaxID=168475 RepID=UPI002545AD79|nr:uncharacterized protein N7495_007738 [Penicillium taxi]KAJ5887697.1 hypothetical protein N7495_007738 [Penicillium taxi]
MEELKENLNLEELEVVDLRYNKSMSEALVRNKNEMIGNQMNQIKAQEVQTKDLNAKIAKLESEIKIQKKKLKDRIAELKSEAKSLQKKLRAANKQLGLNVKRDEKESISQRSRCWPL